MNKENFVYYKLILEFKGTKFLGWQKQKDFNPTVQGELEKACKIIFKSDDIHTIGSGRTDTGVHSLDHHVKLKAPFKIENNSLLKALNSHLDLNIRVLSISDSDNSFLPTNHAKSKEYIYLFSNLESESAFQSDYIVNYRHDLNLS